MDTLAKDLEGYLSEVTGRDTMAEPLNRGELPYFLTQQYALYGLKIGQIELIAVFLKQEENLKPAQFVKHIRQIPKVEIDDVCIVAQSLPTYVRKRLIENGIAFVIPKVQMYIPALGMDFRSRTRRKKPVFVKQFTPPAQVVLIHWLLGRLKDPATPLELSKQLRYSAMSMSRALDGLGASGVAQVELSGRERYVTFQEDRKIVWQKSLPYLRNPVNYTVRILERELNKQEALPAGNTALSVWSMLNKPSFPEYAISRDEWKKMEAEEIPVEEDGTCLLQIWRYDPKQLEVDGQVDPFSLYLSFENETDERVDLALEEMLERYL